MSLNWLSHATLGALLLAGSAAAQAVDSPWQARIGVSKIVPTSDSGSILPGEVDIDSSTGPTVNLAYFFTPNLAIDLLGGLPFKHDIRLGGSKIGSTKQLPPIVSLQYHFAPEARLRPFVGVGLNYTYFFDEKLDNGAELELSDSWGAAFQVGLDVALDDNWTLGGDVRYAKIDSTVKVDGVKVGTVDVDPTVYSVNLGYRF